MRGLGELKLPPPYPEAFNRNFSSVYFENLTLPAQIIHCIEKKSCVPLESRVPINCVVRYRIGFDLFNIFSSYRPNPFDS
jgi:hypothetical protein